MIRTFTNLLSLAVVALSLVPLVLTPEPLGAQVDESLFSSMRYRNIGPHRGGRVTTVAGIPDEPFTYYMGATGGGVWKTTDAGTTWFNISDGYFNTAGIGDIVVAPSDPSVVLPRRDCAAALGPSGQLLATAQYHMCGHLIGRAIVSWVDANPYNPRALDQEA